MGKEEWKNTGKELGGAFTGLAKSLIRSAKTGIDKVEDWAEAMCSMTAHGERPVRTWARHLWALARRS